MRTPVHEQDFLAAKILQGCFPAVQIRQLERRKRLAHRKSGGNRGPGWRGENPQMLLDAVQSKQQATLLLDHLIEKKEHAPATGQYEGEQNARGRKI